MKYVKPITFLLLAISVCTSVWFVSVLKPTSVGAYVFFATWLASPYAVLTSALLLLQSKRQSQVHWLGITAMISTSGILMLSDLIFWHKDAQGAIAVFLVPILQFAAIAVLVALSKWLNAKNSL
jgi:hypothetical protein